MVALGLFHRKCQMSEAPRSVIGGARKLCIGTACPGRADEKGDVAGQATATDVEERTLQEAHFHQIGPTQRLQMCKSTWTQ